MANKKLLIAFDIDSVLLDFLGQFLRIHNLRNGTKVTVDDILTFMPSESMENIITEQEWNDSFEYFEESGAYATLPAYEGTSTTIESLLKLGHEIIYITSRNSIYKKQTELSFLLNKIPLSKIYFVPRGKYQILKRLKPNVFIDDAIKNVKDAERAGIKNIYLMDQPYNRNEEGNKYIRINNLVQLERKIIDENMQ